MKFSIIIPVYNNKEWLPKCFDSILNQTYTNYEIILINDMSEEDIEPILEEYQEKFNKKCQGCKIFHNKTKRLNGGSRNVGIVECDSDYTMAIDCDDWLINDKVLEDINSKLNGEDIMFLGCIMRTKEKDVDLIPVHKSWEDGLKGCLCALWTKCVKTDILKQVLFKEGTLFEDLGHHYRLMLKCKTFTSLGKATHVWNRLNSSSTSNRDDYLWYRFNFCGEMYELIKNTENEELKEYFKNSLKLYLKSCNEMVEKL